MIRKFYALVSILVVFIIMNNHADCQSVSSPLSSEQFRESMVREIGFDQRLVSGDFYIKPPSGEAHGHPYYINGEWKTGTVIIGGKKFDNLLLKFDIEDNKLVLNTSTLSNINLEICLRIKNISRFTLGDIVFIKVENQENSDEVRFYELLSDGEIKLLQLKSKDLLLTTSGLYYYEYNESVSQYILYRGVLKKFRGKSTLTKMFPSHKKAIRKYSHEKKLILTRNNINDRITLLEYCNLLLSNTE